MIKIIEMGISILLLISGVKIGEFYGVSLLEVHLSNGNIFNIKTHQRNSKGKYFNRYFDQQPRIEY